MTDETELTPPVTPAPTPNQRPKPQAAYTERETEQTGIEHVLQDPDVAEAYERHKSKTPVTSDKAVVAAQVVQYLTIFRQEKIDFSFQLKSLALRHAATGALFLGNTAYNVVTQQGRDDLQEALVERLTLRELSAILTQEAVTLGIAPKLPLGSEDSASTSNLRSAIIKLAGKSKDKKELAANLLQLLG